MKRVFIGAAICAALFACANRPASAMVEFCPASLLLQAVGHAQDDASPAAIYGFELTALGARSVRAELAFDTDAGWYTVDVPEVTLTAKDRHYYGVSTFVRRDWISPVMYVRFPSALRINHRWVYQATAQNDGAFGWQQLGTVTCPPPPSPAKRQRVQPNRYSPQLDAKDEDHLDAPPASTSAILAAKPAAPLVSAGCKEPFAEAIATSPVSPNYPDMERQLGEWGTSTIQVAIKSDGTLADAWVWGTSGYPRLDAEALTAAKRTAYRNARSYCMPVPATYFFRVTFNPNA